MGISSTLEKILREFGEILGKYHILDESSVWYKGLKRARDVRASRPHPFYPSLPRQVTAAFCWFPSCWHQEPLCLPGTSRAQGVSPNIVIQLAGGRARGIAGWASGDGWASGPRYKARHGSSG